VVATDRIGGLKAGLRLPLAEPGEAIHLFAIAWNRASSRLPSGCVAPEFPNVN
jgi:hypothetical protein